NGVSNGRARITFFDESASEVWHFESKRRSSLLVTTADVRRVPKDFRVKMSLHRVSSLSKLAAIKSCNYLENLIAIDEAKQTGFAEAIRVNEGGEVVGGCMSNVFWLRDGMLFTPQLSTGCLPGTTREFILEDLDCAEVDHLYDQVHLAEAVFLSSAGLGVRRVSALGGKKLAEIDHPILHLVPKP
ncbi:MAG: aminotransferase class IV, partial [Pyrinomonadaceae bacterium]